MAVDADTLPGTNPHAHPHSVGRTAMALGLAGLLPQLAAVVVVGGARALVATSGERYGAAVAAGILVALGYGALILSFVGGIWWGIAMRRTERQGRLAAMAVLPSLVAAGLVALTFVVGARWSLVLLGSAIAMTLLVDRALVRMGEAPGGVDAPARAIVARARRVDGADGHYRAGLMPRASDRRPSCPAAPCPAMAIAGHPSLWTHSYLRCKRRQ